MISLADAAFAGVGTIDREVAAARQLTETADGEKEKSGQKCRYRKGLFQDRIRRDTRLNRTKNAASLVPWGFGGRDYLYV